MFGEFDVHNFLFIFPFISFSSLFCLFLRLAIIPYLFPHSSPFVFFFFSASSFVLLPSSGALSIYPSHPSPPPPLLSFMPFLPSKNSEKPNVPAFSCCFVAPNATSRDCRFVVFAESPPPRLPLSLLQRGWTSSGVETQYRGPFRARS